MGVLQKTMLAILAVVLAASFFASIWLSGMMTTQMAAAKQNAQQNSTEKPQVFILLSDIDPSFRDEFKKGAQKAAEEFGIELEYANISGSGGSYNYANALEASVAANVDGIILQPAWRDALLTSLDRADEKGIPYITVEEDIPSSNRKCYVGINSFEFGTLAGRLAVQSTQSPANIAVVYRGLNQENDTESSLKLDGLRDVVTLNIGTRIVRAVMGDNAFFGAEDTFRDIMTNNPEVNVLVCMTARDTVAAVQTVLDLNRLRYMQIIGTDLTPEIQDLLDKKVLYGTIARNPDAIGYQSVEAMSRVLENKPVDDFIDVGLKTVKSEN